MLVCSKILSLALAEKVVTDLSNIKLCVRDNEPLFLHLKTLSDLIFYFDTLKTAKIVNAVIKINNCFSYTNHIKIIQLMR